SRHPPRWHAQSDRPSDGTRAADRAVAAARSAVVFPGQASGRGQDKERGPVARRFRGSDTFKVDAKGRVSIPAPFRRVIEASDPDWREGLRANIVIVYGNDRQNWLEVYTMRAIEEIDEQIEDMQRGSPERLMLEERMYGQSVETQID